MEKAVIVDANKAMLVALIATLFFLGFVTWSDSNSEARMVESCVSAGGEWVDITSGPIVNMGCKR